MDLPETPAPLGTNIDLLAQRVLETIQPTLKREIARRVDAKKGGEVVAISRLGPMGRIKVSRSGIAHTAASRVIREFEKRVPSREFLAEALKASPTSGARARQVATLLTAPESKKKSLARIIAECKADPASIIKAYANGAVELGKYEALGEIALALPTVVRALVKEVIPSQTLCKTCMGAGEVIRKYVRGNAPSPEKCKTCDGTGWRGEMSPYAIKASEKVLEMGGLTKGEGGVNVNVSQNVAISNSGVMEKLLGASDPVIEAEFSEAGSSLVLAEDHLEKPREGREDPPSQAWGEFSASPNPPLGSPETL